MELELHREHCVFKHHHLPNVVTGGQTLGLRHLASAGEDIHDQTHSAPPSRRMYHR